MKSKKWILIGFVILLAFGLALSTGCAKKKAEEQAEMEEIEKPETAKPEKEFPVAVMEAIEANVPDAEIDCVEVLEKEGITLYDIEFKEERGEIEVTEEGTVMNIVTIITMEELPEAVAQAINKAAEGITIKRLEKSEIRSEIKKKREKSIIIKLDTPRYVYKAELMRDDQTGEITVDADGNIVEPLEWDTN